jgi:excisionase family DNA binding protein
MTARQVLTPAQAAVLLGIGKTTVTDRCQRGVLPAIRLDSRWYLKRSEPVRDGWLMPARENTADDAAVDAEESGR